MKATLVCGRYRSRTSAPHGYLLALGVLAGGLMLVPRMASGDSQLRHEQRSGEAGLHLPTGTAPREAAPAPTPQAHSAGNDGEPAEPRVHPPDAIGSLSVGHPHAGFLLNAMQMPTGRQWLLSVPSQAWGTEETIRALVHCICRVNERYPDSPRVVIGSISARHGGALLPHKSHRTGRDADVHFYLTERGARWYEPATAQNLDRPRTWALLRAIVTETDVEYVLIDRSVQVLLEEYALGVESDRGWVVDLFHGTGKQQSPLVKHIPGHTGHMHIRFFSPIAQERGRRAYDRLVEQGHIVLRQREVKYTVEPGDTLSEIAQRRHTSVDELMRRNGLDGTAIVAGTVLVVQEAQDLRGARDKVALPARRLPRESSLASVGRAPVIPTNASVPTASTSDLGPVRTSSRGASAQNVTPDGKADTLRAALLELERDLSQPR